jgi:hypothetical protein
MGSYEPEWWPDAWKQTRCKYQFRHIELFLQADTTVKCKTIDQIAIREAIVDYRALYEQLRRQPFVEVQPHDPEINFPEFSILFADTRSKAKIVKLDVFDVLSWQVDQHPLQGIMGLTYRCSNESLAAGIYPRFEYEEINRVREISDANQWEWEKNSDQKCYLYEETWGSKQIFYNLTFYLPINGVPYFVATSPRTMYTIQVKDEQITIHFSNFKRIMNINIGFRFAPISYNMLLSNQEMVAKNQSSANRLVDAIRVKMETKSPYRSSSQKRLYDLKDELSRTEIPPYPDDPYLQIKEWIAKATPIIQVDWPNVFDNFTRLVTAYDWANLGLAAYSGILPDTYYHQLAWFKDVKEAQEFRQKILHFLDGLVVLSANRREALSKTNQSVHIHLGEKATVETLVVSHSITNSFNKIESAKISYELKQALQNLASSVNVMMGELPDEVAKQVAHDMETLTAEATSKSPRPAWYQLSIEGLKKAAEDVGEIGVPVLKCAAAVLALMMKV